MNEANGTLLEIENVQVLYEVRSASYGPTRAASRNPECFRFVRA